jgi:hypothetical protein
LERRARPGWSHVGNRILPIFLALLLLQGVVPLLGTQASAAGGPAGLELGYGPGTLFPTGTGTPVYSSGDELWVLSQLNGTALLKPLFPENASVAVPVEQGVPTRAYVFGPSDPLGPWTLQLEGTPYPPVVFLLSTDSQAQPGLSMSSWDLGAEGLAMNFSMSADIPFYDASACILGGGDHGTATVPVPSSYGGGAVNVTMVGDSLNVLGSSLGNSSFAFSAQLYYTYSFLAPNSSSTFISRAVMVQASDAMELSKSQPGGTVGLHSEAAPRQGEYQLRVFYQGASGLSVQATDVVVTGGFWVWLGGCQGTPVSTQDFSLVFQLGTDPGSWPREVLLDYRVSGVEAYALAHVGLNMSAATFTGEPWGVPLAGYTPSLTRSEGIAKAVSAGGTEFVVLAGSSGSFDYALSLGSQTLLEGSSVQLTPFAVSVVPLNVSRLQVTYSVGGVAYQGGTVNVGDQRGPLASQTTDSRGSSVFYLPGGGYDVNASGGGRTAQGTVALVDGQSAALSLGGPGPQSGPGTLELLLAAAAVAGLVLDAVLIAIRRRRGKVYWREPPGPPRVSPPVRLVPGSSSRAPSWRSCWPQA